MKFNSSTQMKMLRKIIDRENFKNYQKTSKMEFISVKLQARLHIYHNQTLPQILFGK